MDSALQKTDSLTTILTANRRQAAQRLSDHDRAQQAAGNTLWQTPDILPWEAWLRRLWDELLVESGANHPLLLSSHQERLLWEQVIHDSPLAGELLQPVATAQRAQEAWRLLHAYEESLPSEAEIPSPDVSAFVAWATTFSRYCDERHWLDGARLSAYLTDRLRGDRIPLPNAIELHGFDLLTPAQRSLLATAEQRGCRIREAQSDTRARQAVRIECDDVTAEVERAARWARQRLESGEEGRIGIVVHDLTAQRHKVQRIFSQVLDPAAQLPGTARQPRFNISLGHSLSEFPVIHSALEILALAENLSALEVERLGALLRSPFIEGGEEEMGHRARLDAVLREWGEPAVSIKSLLFHASEGAGAAPILVERLSEWRAHRQQLNYRQSVAAWARDFTESLNRCGWPRGRPLDSDEFQAVEAWRAVIGQFTALDEVAGLVSYGKALSKLRQLAAETLFQPRSPELPLQILGLLEAEGLNFDHLWVMGWHDEVWPAPPQPHPLLPVAMQRRSAMPHSSAARELAFARGITERLLAAAPDVVVSWPSREADRELRPSPLIRQLPETDEAGLDLALAVSFVEAIFRSARWEAIDDQEGLPYPEHAVVRGGSAVFKEQAACPFRAYARLRLGGEPLGTPRPGLDAPARGSLLHRALEYFWQTVPDQGTLKALTPEERRQRVAGAVRQAIAVESKRRPITFSDRYSAVEQARLSHRLESWLEVELERAPFQVVGAEKQRELEIGQLRVKTRIDRIDRLDDGRQVIIDYKSGKTSVQAWLGERPDEPQLPLYALSSEAPLAALAFAELRPGECRFKGLAEEAELLPQVGPKARGLDPDWEWEVLLGEWSLLLSEIAQDFRAGDARVDPKKGGETCRYCALTVLCRIAEAELVPSEDAGDE